MWEAKPRLSSLPTTARLMNILEAKHRWKSAAPTRPRTSSPLGRTKGTNSLAASSSEWISLAQILPLSAGASHLSK